MTAIIEAINLSKSVRSDRFFKSLQRKMLWQSENLSIQNPGLTLIAGRNGAGKSTLVRCLLGLTKPTTGSVTWFGQSRFLPHDVGYVPEFPILSPSLTVRRYLKWLLGKSSAQISALQRELANFPTLGVDGFLDAPASRLSKGQQQRIQLWAALSHHPKGLVLDEPFSGLDPWARVELSELLCALLNEGKFVLIASHELTQKLRSRVENTWVVGERSIKIFPGCALPE